MKEVFGNDSLSSVVRTARRKHGLSVSELARRLDLSQSFVSEIEAGKKYPSPGVLLKLAKVLDLNIDTLAVLDERVPYDDLRRIVNRCPQMGEAFRRLVAQAKNGTSVESMAKQILAAIDKADT